MSRLANTEKAGYFPLPPLITDLIGSYLVAPHGGRILDPCAGEGVALASLAEKLGIEPFGVELHQGRAEVARKMVSERLPPTHDKTVSTRILHDSYLNLFTSRAGYNLLYLNPPYEYDETDGRLEYQWLVHTRPWLQTGGVLLWVVPQHLLRFRKATAYIASWYDQVQIYRFPDGAYEQFKQIVLFAVHRPKAVMPSAEQIEKWGQLTLDKQQIAPLTAVSEPLYTVPPLAVKRGAFKFRSQFVDPVDALAECQQLGARTKAAWREHLGPTNITVGLRPLTPLKIGHMNSIIAAGHLNNQLLNNGAERLLIKGRSYKVSRAEQFEEPLPDGRTRVTHLETETVVTDISTIDETGEIVHYKGGELEQFLQKWISQLTRIVAQDYAPVYHFDLNGYADLLNNLSKQRPIPGMPGESGLLPAQKHAVAAVLTRLQCERDAIVVGEMGVGKTTVGAAIAAGRDARRTIILCPPHLVDKWQREFKAVWPTVRTMHLQTIRDVDQFFARQVDDAPLVGVLKQTTARSASGWEHAYDGLLLGRSPDVLTEEQQVALRRIWQQRGIRCPVCGQTQFINGRPLTANEFKTATRRCSYANCQSPLYQFVRQRSPSQTKGDFKLHAQREQLIRSYIDKGQPLPLSELQKWCGDTVKDTFGYGKVPLAGYIKKRGKGKVDLLLVDEVHQYKGFDSDQGYAMHHLAQTAVKVVALTGTIYGGKASSLFYLLFRLAPEMCRFYINPEASGQRRLGSQSWVSAYGILQRIETSTLGEDGKQTANSRSNVRFKELPGGSPAMLPWLLNRSVFLSLGDMGFPLPEYNEIPVAIAMAPAQSVLYESLKEQLKEELRERLLRGDKSLLAGYLHALLFWPDSPRRAKVVECPRSGKVVASVPALPDDFVGPKEAEIIKLCLQEKSHGRRVILFCQQTDTLDIQPEWKQMLEAAGIKVAILRAAPHLREKWVTQQVEAGIDVLITHPRKVETGIDLLDFPTIIWMAIDYSVYTVLQASRRSWRIGQTCPVKVYYFAYKNSLQEDALQLVASKIAAALRVNGDTVESDSLADLDDLATGDLVATLAKIVTGQTKLEAPSLQQAFAAANATLRQANTLIGEYTLVEAREDAVALAAPKPEGQQTKRPLAVGRNGHTQQPSLFPTN